MTRRIDKGFLDIFIRIDEPWRNTIDKSRSERTVVTSIETISFEGRVEEKKC